MKKSNFMQKVLRGVSISGFMNNLGKLDVEYHNEIYLCDFSFEIILSFNILESK